MHWKKTTHQRKINIALFKKKAHELLSTLFWCLEDKRQSEVGGQFAHRSLMFITFCLSKNMNQKKIKV